MGKRRKSQVEPEPVSLVLPPSLYLGPYSAASDKSFLISNSVTHVLSIGPNPSRKVDGITYRRLALNDSASSSIFKVVDAVCVIIDRVIASKMNTGKIRVHYAAGVSRSPMVVAAYLMKRRGMSLRAALGQIIRVRPQILPNVGFLQQLKEMEMELFGTISLDVEELPEQEKDRLALFEVTVPNATETSSDV